MKPTLKSSISALEHAVTTMTNTIADIEQFCKQQNTDWSMADEGTIQAKKIELLNQLKAELEGMIPELIELQITDELSSN